MNEKHIRENNCPVCCCNGLFIHENCGGKMHERLIDDTIDDGFIHNYKCDKCNFEDYHYGYEDMKIEFKDE